MQRSLKNLSNYPLALQLLMQTDGTVTELIKLLAQEDIRVHKVSEEITKENKSSILHRHIYLQGVITNKYWLYAQSKIYLDNLSDSFVTDLLEHSIPIGTLWGNYRMETYKKLMHQYEELSDGCEKIGLKPKTKLLARVYHVFNQQKVIMEITEKFPLLEYKSINF